MQGPTQTSEENAPQEQVTVKSLSGFEDGQEIQSEGEILVVRGDYDESGNVIGWHKEPKQISGDQI